MSGVAVAWTAREIGVAGDSRVMVSRVAETRRRVVVADVEQKVFAMPTLRAAVVYAGPAAIGKLRTAEIIHRFAERCRESPGGADQLLSWLVASLGAANDGDVPPGLFVTVAAIANDGPTIGIYRCGDVSVPRDDVGFVANRPYPPRRVIAALTRGQVTPAEAVRTYVGHMKRTTADTGGPIDVLRLTANRCEWLARAPKMCTARTMDEWIADARRGAFPCHEGRALSSTPSLPFVGRFLYRVWGHGRW